MRPYTILSDSSCDLPTLLAKEMEIDIVPYYVTFDTVHYYKENIEISNDAFYKKVIEEKAVPKTSLPSAGDYMDKFEKHLQKGEDILCICLSSVFSGSFQSANTAKEMLLEEYPESQIVVIDSKQATGGQGLLVYQAAMMKKAGLSLQETAEKLNILKTTAKINFTVDSLEHLQKGGRIGKASALAGSLLNIKPIIAMTDGELLPTAKVRGTKKALKTIIDMTAKEIGENKDAYDVCLIASVRTGEIPVIEKALKEEYGIYPFPSSWPIGVTIGTHAGPTAIGICYIKKYTQV